MGDHTEQHGVHFDPTTMQTFQAFAVFMQQHHATKRREILATKAIQAVVNKMDQFDGKDVTKYLHEYVKEMELHCVSKGEMIQSFELVVVPKIREHVRAIKDLHERNWKYLKLALKEKYFMEDSERVTKRTFLEWVARPKEGLSVTELLREFERRYALLTRMENSTLDAEKTKLFLQAVGKEFQEKLKLLLEDKDAEQGLKTDWNEVEDDVSLLAKRQRKRDKMQTKEGFVHRCIWCDSTDHTRRDCDGFSDALRKDVVFFKDDKIHFRETDLPLRTNFGKGGMQTIVEDMATNHATSSIEAATYGVKFENFRDKEKRRCKNGDEGPSKRSTRSGGKNDATPPRAPPTKEAPSPEMTMEESTTGKKKEPTKGKQKGPAYKLQSDIELATNLKKVLEERILNSKVEFTLGEVLGIAKHKFHEEIIDIIKRKRQTLGEAIGPQAKEGLSKTQGMQLQAKESNVASIGCYQSSSKLRQVQFAKDDEEYRGIPTSHSTRTHWVQATTETLVKIGDLEEPIVALIDHRSEIDIMSKNLYNKCKWPMDTEHGWMIKVANNSSGELYAACPSVKVIIGDIKVEQNFFIQDTSFYHLILGQPYIMGV
ncbi:hypothetical protein L7F22_057377 [Adiantum nelumboides]|nr:hypothetical protein [Adiantum nelumboides]